MSTNEEQVAPRLRTTGGQRTILEPNRLTHPISPTNPHSRYDSTSNRKKTSLEFAFHDTWAIFEGVVSGHGLSTGSSGARDVRGATGIKAGTPAFKNDPITTRPTVRIQA